MSLTVKAFLEKKGQETEIRRFPVPADCSSNYDYLFKKIADVFPGLGSGNFTLYWKDDENDSVRFSSDDELMSALSFRQGDVFKVFVHEHIGTSDSEKEGSNGQFHPNVTCDGCEGPIYGPRFKCYVCPDYDLCSTCESSGTHSEHEMLKIPAPKDSWMGFIPPPPHFRRWMNHFMRKWHNQHPQGNPASPCNGAEGKPAEGEQKPSEEQPKAPGPDSKEEEEDVGEQFLQDVGASVAAMLDPLGIDVSVDVETGCPKPQKRGGRRGRGHGPWGAGHPGPWGSSPHGPWGPGPHGPWGPGPHGPCGPGPHGPWAPGFFAGGPCGFGWGAGMKGKGGQCKRGQAGKCPMNGESDKTNPKESKPQTEEPMEASAPPQQQVPIVPTKIQPAQSTGSVDGTTNNQQTDAAKSDSPNGDWTVVYPSLSQVETDSTMDITQCIVPTPQPAAEEPKDPKIAKALQQMKDMGFSNEGGWLTRLVEMKKGDISQCLDAIKPLRVVEPTGEHKV